MHEDGVLIRVLVVLAVGEDESGARSLSPGGHGPPGSPSSPSSITIARSVFVETASARQDELVSHVSSCPLPILSLPEP